MRTEPEPAQGDHVTVVVNGLEASPLGALCVTDRRAHQVLADYLRAGPAVRATADAAVQKGTVQKGAERPPHR